MNKLWAGRFSKQLDETVNDFNSSISIDSRMYRQDIEGSLAHAAMLCACGILTQSECDSISAGLSSILSDLDSGKLSIDPECEDIHTFVETELTARIGDDGKKLHTARSRNDQVALDTRMYLRTESADVRDLLKKLITVLCDLAEEHTETVMPGYTHLQRAQPIVFGQHLMAYAMMFLRDLGRLQDAEVRLNCLPLGCCALAGTTFPTDRAYTASLLSFDDLCHNSLDGVSDRDFCIELASALSLIMMHLSRFSEEIILWCSWEFKFIELDDGYSTGSSIMPQKKNPDIAELVRGKTGRVYGDLMTLLTLLKGLPLAYNKDLQEDKEAVFDAFSTVKGCLTVFAPMLSTMTVLPDNMRAAAAGGFINATDCADYLAKKGVPFRAAYKTVGEIVAYCVKEKKTLESLSLEEYQRFCAEFDTDLYDAISLDKCVQRRLSEGGTAPDSVKKQIQMVREKIKD